MNRELLEKPFLPEQIKQRQGNFGQTLDYVEGHAVIQRLNDAFDGKWDFEILENQILEDKDEVIVMGRLTTDGTVKTQFGSSKVTRAKETGEIVSLADDLKAAATDALKKAATLLGIGLHLYNSRGGSDKPGQHQSADNSGGHRNNAHGGEGNGRLSSKQHTYILDLISKRGMTRKELNSKCVEKYGVVLDYLTRTDASNLINELLNQ